MRKPNYRYIRVTESQLSALIEMLAPGDDTLDIDMGPGELTTVGIPPKLADRILTAAQTNLRANQT